jgi:hypothetical protein
MTMTEELKKLPPAPFNAKEILAERRTKFARMRTLLVRWVTRSSGDRFYKDLQEKTLEVLDHE